MSNYLTTYKDFDEAKVKSIYRQFDVILNEPLFEAAENSDALTDETNTSPVTRHSSSTFSSEESENNRVERIKRHTDQPGPTKRIKYENATPHITEDNPPAPEDALSGDEEAIPETKEDILQAPEDVLPANKQKS